MYIIYMFHKAKTEADRQKIFDEYLLHWCYTQKK
jgi:hypothetical protein